MMECFEQPDALPPRPECRCRACATAREDSIPVKLRLLVRQQQAALLTRIDVSGTLIHRAFSAYIAGHIGLAEMQVELIVALAKQVDDQHQQLVGIAMREPTLQFHVGSAPGKSP